MQTFSEEQLHACPAISVAPTILAKLSKRAEDLQLKVRGSNENKIHMLHYLIFKSIFNSPALVAKNTQKIRHKVRRNGKVFIL